MEKCDPRILFENADIVALEKPEGLATIPERALEKPSLLRAAEAAVGQRLFIVHRIDKEASGVVVFAKGPDAHRALNRQFANREVSKTYLALAHGAVERDGMIEKPIRPYGSGRMGVDGRKGKPCATRFEISRRVGPCTLLNVFPVTGRRHQIRVHLYSVGHPVVGDLRYGDRDVQGGFPRLMLHASALGFRSPTGEAVRIDSPMPTSFSRVLERLEGGKG